MAEQPTGTVTMLFTDIEGSTRLLERLGTDVYGEVLELHRCILREAFARHDGYEVDAEGDAFFVAFPSARGAVAAAVAAQVGLAGATWPWDGLLPVRMGIHTGQPRAFPPKYVGMDVHRAARIMAAAHGGQVLVSLTSRDLLEDHLVLKDLGEHRLKDLSAPIRLFQVGEGSFPALKTLFNVSLPIQLTPLVGRGRDVRAVAQALREGVRLMTVTGPGGIGKTRLALQAAAEAAEAFPGGVWFVSLGEVSAPELVEEAITTAVGATAGLAARLEGDPSLLVLDNFEHVLAAASTVQHLLTATSGVHVLATSRQKLGLRAEHEFVLDPLPPTEAAELFAVRARQALRDFQPDEHVPQIVRLVDGLPLAIELAAARVKVLSTAEIAGRLSASIDLLGAAYTDLPERQRTLRVTIEWSLGLLAPDEHELFVKLAVFDGRFTVSDVERVLGSGPDEVSSLVDKSLLRRTADAKVFMLRTLRSQALMLFERRSDHAELREQQATWMVELIGEGLTALEPVPPDTSVLMGPNELEPNLRLALQWLETHRAEAFADVVARLFGFWHVSGQRSEGYHWTRRALELAGPRVDLLSNAAYLAARVLGPALDEALGLAQQQLELARSIGDAHGEANALRGMGVAYVYHGDLAAAERCYIEGRDIAAKHDLLYEWFVCTANVADVALNRGEWSRVIEVLVPTLEPLEQLGYAESMLVNAYNLAQAELRSGQLDDAVEHIDLLLRWISRLDFAEMRALAFFAAAELALARAADETAAKMAAAAAATMEAIEGWIPHLEQALLDRIRSRVRSLHGEERAAELEREGRVLTADAALEFAHAVLNDAKVVAPRPVS